jgi:SepF-like predicted cell division protein (DUF552 family)
MVIKSFKKGFSKLMNKEAPEEEYIEIDLDENKDKKQKVVVKLFRPEKYDDVNEILAVLREGYTIAIIDCKVLRSKEIIELKRAVAKIKKTITALEGNINGFGDNIIIATPSFAIIEKDMPQVKESKPDYMDRY